LEKQFDETLAAFRQLPNLCCVVAGNFLAPAGASAFTLETRAALPGGGTRGADSDGHA